MSKYTVNTYADYKGFWRAEIRFNNTKSYSDSRSGFNLYSAISYARRLARKAIIDEITAREQRTHESYEQARARVSDSLPRLHVIRQNIDSLNRWHGITLGE